MEMVLSNGFCEMSQNQMENVEGGAFQWTPWAVAVTVSAVASAYNELYQLGYTIGSWFR